MKLSRQYKTWLADLKQNISRARLQTSLQVNANMLLVYWYLGKQIQQKVEGEGWGAKVIEQLAKDLQKAFPDMKGLSARNLKYMRQFASEYTGVAIGQQAVAQIGNSTDAVIGQQAAAQMDKSPNSVIGQQLAAQFVQQPVAQIPWGHHMLLLDKIFYTEERNWYIQQTIKNGWSRNVLLHHISTNLYHRQAKKKATTNFHLTLPKAQSDLANQILKDPYHFDFLNLSENFSERELEKKLVDHIQSFLIELGAGFAFVCRQYKLKISRKEYQFDLLFYHLELRCYIIIDLKIGEFEPEHAGKMNAYLNALNKLVKKDYDNPTLGIILCTEKDEIDVEFALGGLGHPIGVSEYKTLTSLPKNLRDKLPSAKQLKDAVKEFNAKMKGALK